MQVEIRRLKLGLEPPLLAAATQELMGWSLRRKTGCHRRDCELDIVEHVVLFAFLSSVSK
jgi:hypothetical protein